MTIDARPESGEGLVAGDVINTAARLQSAAPVNGVLVGEATQRATQPAIEYRPHPPVEAKGKRQPIPVWEAVTAPVVVRRRRRTAATHPTRRVESASSTSCSARLRAPAPNASRSS